MKLRLRGISLSLGAFELALDITLEQPVTGIFGPSGAGKTTLLDLIAGLRRPASAFIELDGEILTDTAVRRFLPPRVRRIGYVPQDGALFPHFSVRRNLLYGDREPPGSFLSLEHVAEVLQIAPLLERRVGDLSGGEKQRVACGRALLSHPRLLLLDEPLTGLDQALRRQTLDLFHRVWTEFGVPMIFVSHVPEEIVALCDETIVLERGRCVRQGPVAELFTAFPATAYRLSS